MFCFVMAVVILGSVFLYGVASLIAPCIERLENKIKERSCE